jgi:hypothetical protein
MKQDYIKKMTAYLNSPHYDLEKMKKELKQDDFKINRDPEQMKLVQYSILQDYESDQWEEALELIIGARGYFVSHFDLLNIARLYNKNILLLRDPVIALKSTRTYNFGSHYVHVNKKNNKKNKDNKDNKDISKEEDNKPKETLMFVSYKIPLEKNYRSITNILSYDETEKDDEKIYKPFVPNRYLDEENTRWIEDYRKWTKAGGNREIKVYKIN